MNKKNILFFTICHFSIFLNALSFTDLLDNAFNNNIDILNSNYELNLTSLEAKNFNGKYFPSLNVSSGISDVFINEDFPGVVTAGVSLSQNIPDGSNLNLDFSYSVYKNENSVNDDFIKNPSVTVSLSQSLFPFWIQGKISDPAILSYKLQQKYKEVQLYQTKKVVFQNLTEIYLKYLILCDQILIKENNLSFCNEQLSLTRELEVLGEVSHSKVVEIENNKRSQEQNLFSLYAEKVSIIKSLEDLCCISFNENEEFENFLNENNFTEIVISQGLNKDFIQESYEIKLELYKNNVILQKQNAAPVLNFSSKTSWLQDINNSSVTSFSIGINFAPLINGLTSEYLEKQNLEEKNILQLYNSYIKQKEYLAKQYNSILNFYNSQLALSEKSWEENNKSFLDAKKQLENGAISKIEFEARNLEYKNAKLNTSILQKYCLLYEVLKILCEI